MTNLDAISSSATVGTTYSTKYMTFRKLLSGKWAVLNNRGQYTLGEIVYYSGWRQYVFQPSEGIEFNNTCLTEIAVVLSKLNGEG